jgi:tRNA-dihydrouridine synthase B
MVYTRHEVDFSARRLSGMKIGNLHLDNNLILAPMAGVTDCPFRTLCRRFEAGLAIAEMLSADTALWGTRKSLRRLDCRGEPRPVAVQIVGADPSAMAEAASRRADAGADLVDINMGCPAKKVCKVAAGSALLRDERLVARILEAVVTAVGVPVTLKIRTGWSPTERNAPRIARIAWESGIAALTVHGRTRACGYAVAADYETIRTVKAEVPIALVANGDIDGPEKARQVLDYTGASAIIMRRAAQGRPWIFQEILRFLETGTRAPAPSGARIREILPNHLKDLCELYGTTHGVRIARKHVARYCSGRGGARQFMARFNRIETPEEQQRLIERFFNRPTQQEERAA